MDGFAELAGIARGQHGMTTRAQVLTCGVPPGRIQRWLDTGRLETLHPGVYRLGGAPATWEQAVAAAVAAAGPGAVASHRAAARLWGLHDADRVEVSIRHSRALRLRGVVVHRSLDLGRATASRRRGIAVTNPLRTLVDLGAVLDKAQVEDALDRALVSRLVTIAGAEGALSEVSRRGRRGAGVLRAVLDGRALGDERPDSLLEPRMARLLRAHGFPSAVFQHPVTLDGGFVANPDFAYPDRRIAIEVDGFESHSTPRALQADLDRQNLLVAGGWTVLRFTWADVVRRPNKVASAVARVL